MPAKIQTDQARALRNARDAAREGDAERARLWLHRAEILYPVTRKQRAAIQALLNTPTK